RPAQAAEPNRPSRGVAARASAREAGGGLVRWLLGGWRPAQVLAALLGAWELYADVGTSGRRLIFPAPHQVASALYSDRGLLWSNFLVTFREIVLGILLAAVAAFALAVAIHFSQTLRGALYPLIVAS